MNNANAHNDDELLARINEDILRAGGLIDEQISRLKDRLNRKTRDEDYVPGAPKVPTSKRGEIYELGNHRLMCGDSTDLVDVKDLMNGVKGDMVFTDPPYNVAYVGKSKEEMTIMNDKMEREAFRDFLTTAFAVHRKVMSDDAAYYICYASRKHREFEDALNAAGIFVREQIIWAKNNAAFGWADYRWKHEPIMYASVDGRKTYFAGGRTSTTVWDESWDADRLISEMKRYSEQDPGTTIWRIDRNKKHEHPTQKPVELVEIAIKNSSKRGQAVVDLFGGSGTTLIAAEKLSRRCFIMELDPVYCDIIRARYERYTRGQ